MLIERIQTQFTLVHEVQIGGRTFNVPPGSSDFDHTIHPDDFIYAKLPREDDWYNYGRVRDFLYESNGLAVLQLFMKNTNTHEVERLINEKSSSGTSPQPKKTKWW